MTRAAPSSRAAAVCRAILAALSAMSPTVALIWASATRSGSGPVVIGGLSRVAAPERQIEVTRFGDAMLEVPPLPPVAAKAEAFHRALQHEPVAQHLAARVLRMRPRTQLVRASDGQRVRMGSGYDELGPRAHTQNASGEVLRNRLMPVSYTHLRAHETKAN